MQVAQLEAENEALKRKNKSLTTDLAAARRKSAGSPGSAAGSLSPVAAQAQAKSIESAMIKALSAQMVYKPSLKNPGKSAITQVRPCTHPKTTVTNTCVPAAIPCHAQPRGAFPFTSRLTTQ